MSAVQIKVLKDELKTTNQRLDSFGNELKILLAEINVISHWISGKFGVELMDNSEYLMKHIHNYEEVEEIAGEISSQYTSNKRRKVLKTRNTRPKRILTESGCSDEEAENYSEFITPINAEPEVCKENPVKRKRGRPRKAVECREDVLAKPRGRRKKTIAVDTSISDKCFKEPRTRGRPKKKRTEEETGLDSNLSKTETVQAQCEQCGKVLKDASSLRQHIHIHRNIRPHICVTCGKCFRRKFHLKTHFLIHTGDKKHQCRFCGKLFLLPKDLIAHERCIHTGERPFQCNVCTKNFNIKSHLTMHLRVHTGEKPYKCDICDKCFSQANSLRVHKKTHLKDKQDFEIAQGEAPAFQANGFIEVNRTPTEFASTHESRSNYFLNNEADTEQQLCSLNEIQHQRSTLDLRHIMLSSTSTGDTTGGSQPSTDLLRCSSNSSPGPGSIEISGGFPNLERPATSTVFTTQSSSDENTTAYF